MKGHTGLRLTRRDSLRGLGSSLVVCAVPVPLLAPTETEAAEAAPLPVVRPQAVVSFFMDQPYLDPTGSDLPYQPVSGARSAQPLAHSSDEAIRRGFGWL